ncbi:MAG TPA: trehalose-6-phosphate synthase [Terriglobales bacterium]|nr:trehalose-6-phosphate synthase [Terriglobales bacterium]
MRLLSARLIVSLIVGITLVSSAFSYYSAVREKRALRTDLQHRAQVLTESLVGNVERSWNHGSNKDRELEQLVQRFGNREHLLGVAIYDDHGALVAITPDLRKTLNTVPPVALQAINEGHEDSGFVKVDGQSLLIMAAPVRHDDSISGSLAVVHDAGYIRSQIMQSWRQSFLGILAQVVLIVSITLLIIRWSIAGPIARAALWMRALRTGKTFRHDGFELDVFRPLAREVATIAESLNRARNAAENEARLRDAAESLWTADRLAVQVRTRLNGSNLYVVSNREPYTHKRDGRDVEVVVPPSGLVTALEPILNACNGTWIAHGSGNADMEVVDSHDRLRVPPDDPHYTLRRVWLTKEEEEGYYYGFANEGLWPLCHIAHTRPLFRASDWQAYQEVNAKFTAALLEEIEGDKNPVVLVQDYHFALVPQMIKEKRPDARVAIFWHIPWPNPEAFGICPWQRQLVDGLLGADLIGFHVQSHCNNFLQTVDRVVESRIDLEHFCVLRHGHGTLVRPFPISVALSDDEASSNDGEEPPFWYDERETLLRGLGVEASYLGVGVDRVDYTKGILERFLAIERFLEKYPAYQGKFTFVQIGAPSRTHIKRYHDLLAEVESEAERINWRFQAGKWKPIVYLARQHSHKEIEAYYRSADLCLVTSLHDGMNLVAKEFLAARKDERGVLILSQFTGAARELRDALLINPYDIERSADAIRAALEMAPEEKQLRIQRMRRVIKENNIYRWAAKLIAELAEVRLDKDEQQMEEAEAHREERKMRVGAHAA